MVALDCVPRDLGALSTAGAWRLCSGDLITGLETSAKTECTLCSLHSFTLALWRWTLMKVMARVCTNCTPCLTLSGEFLKGKMAVLQKCWMTSCEQCRGTIICGSCFVFEFLGTGVVTTCDMWNKVHSSTAKWFSSRESPDVANSLLDGVLGLCVQAGKHSEMCVFWWKCLWFMSSYGMHFGAIWCHSSSHYRIMFQLYLWRCPLIMLLSLYICLVYIFTWKYVRWLFGKYLIVYILNIMFFFLFDNKYRFKQKFLVFMIEFVSLIVCMG